MIVCVAPLGKRGGPPTRSIFQGAVAWLAVLFPLASYTPALMPAATCTNEKVASMTQSVALMRNLMRINVSQIVYTRGSFPASDFETRDVNMLRVQSLGGEHCSETAKTLISWLEDGIFDAISRGYLEKAILCMSADKEANDVYARQARVRACSMLK